MVRYSDDIVHGITLLIIVITSIVFIFLILFFWSVIPSLIICAIDIFGCVIKVNHDQLADVFILFIRAAFDVIIRVVKCSF